MIKNWRKIGGTWTYVIKTQEHPWERTVAYVIYASDAAVYRGEVFSSGDLTKSVAFNHFTDMEELKRVIETTAELMG